jgi:hypothetical protein
MTHDDEARMTVRYTDEPEWIDEEIDEEEDELPRRPRRRLLTPITGALAAVVLVAAGFLAGVEVQKSQDSGAATAQTGFPGVPGGGGAGGNGPPGGPGAGQGSGSESVRGTVSNLRGATLYVTDDSGNTVRVSTRKRAEVVRAASSRPVDVQPGDTVIVQGEKNDDGSYSADQITATADGVDLFGGFGAGGPPQGGPPGG